MEQRPIQFLSIVFLLTLCIKSGSLQITKPETTDTPGTQEQNKYRQRKTDLDRYWVTNWGLGIWMLETSANRAWLFGENEPFPGCVCVTIFCLGHSCVDVVLDIHKKSSSSGMSGSDTFSSYFTALVI